MWALMNKLIVNGQTALVPFQPQLITEIEKYCDHFLIDDRAQKIKIQTICKKNITSTETITTTVFPPGSPIERQILRERVTHLIHKQSIEIDLAKINKGASFINSGILDDEVEALSNFAQDALSTISLEIGVTACDNNENPLGRQNWEVTRSRPLLEDSPPSGNQ